MAKIIILSGAGISAESGISTFRDDNGLWENHKIEDVCVKGCLQTNRKMTINFYNILRTGLKTKEPNKAHIEVAKLKNKYPNDIAIITQNVDDLFEKAGCSEVIHLHGFLKHLRCESCNDILNISYDAQDDQKHICKKCNTLLRPNIVFFKEQAPMYEKLYKELDDCQVLVVIGTSGAVINTDMFLNPDIKLSILNNLEESAYINDTVYSKVLYKKASDAIDEIIVDVEDYLNKISSNL